MSFSTKTLLAVVAVLARATAGAPAAVDGNVITVGISCEGGCPEGMVCSVRHVPHIQGATFSGCVHASQKRQDACGGCREGWECNDTSTGLMPPACVPSVQKRQDACGGCREGWVCYHPIGLSPTCVITREEIEKVLAEV